MEIVPWIGTRPVTADTITVKVNPEDRLRAQSLLLRTGVIESVTDQGGFTFAKRAAGELKAMVDEIDDSKKGAKRPFAAVNKAIDELAVEIGQPVISEHKRILALLNGYIARLEAEAKEAERQKTDALQKQIAAEQEKLREAKAKQAQAEEEARRATDELDQARARERARTQAIAAEQAQLSAEMAGEIAQIGEKPKRGFVPGGRVDHSFEFTLVDVQHTVKAGGWRLLRWELDRMACADSCRSQLEINPDQEPMLPGIEVKRKINVSVRASARIE